MQQLRALVPLLDGWPLVVKGAFGDGPVGDLVHHLHLGGDHWEALAQDQQEVERGGGHRDADGHAPLLPVGQLLQKGQLFEFTF